MNRWFIVLLMLFGPHSFAGWTEFKAVGQLQSYGGGMQVWLQEEGCPNTKPYFTLSETYTTNVERIMSMVLMAKASQMKIRFEYNTVDSATYCYVTGIQIQ